MQTRIVKFVSTLYDEEGTSRPVVPDNGVHFTLEELYKLLDTDMVQVVAIDRAHIMIMDEEGKMKDKNENVVATMLVRHNLLPGDIIVGKALVCLTMQFR